MDILNKEGKSAFSYAQDFPELKELIFARTATEESSITETVASP